MHKLRQKGNEHMGQIIEALKNIKGEYVDVYIEHKLFGNQHVKVKLEPEVEKGLGFRCKDQVIYVKNNDIISCYVELDKIIINGSVMSITIVK